MLQENTNFFSHNDRPFKFWYGLLYAVSALLIVAGLVFAVNTMRDIHTAKQAEQASKIPPVSRLNHNPNRVVIPALSIDAPVVFLGLNSDGSLQVPQGADEVGWYTGGAAPGENGTAVLVGHLNTVTGPAVFWNLNKLKTGDAINITRSDGSPVQFKVTKLAAYSYNNFPDAEVYDQTPGPSLRLLTCSGKYNPVTRHYSHNLVVYAEMSGNVPARH